MSFVAKNPLSMTEIENTPSTPPGTRGLFAKKDGFYEVDENGNSSKLYNLENLNISKKYYGDIGIIPSPEEWFNVTINEDNTCIITGLSGVWIGLNTYDYAFHIVIPYEIEGNKVVGIKRDAFAEVGLNSVVIPNTITSIGDSAFYYNNFKSIIIPDSVTEIGDVVFGRCTNLTHVSIPNTINNIDLFGYCDKLTHVDIPNSVTSIGMMSFFNCASLTHVDIPDSVTEIREEAFDGCTNLKTINIPDSVTNIEYCAIPSTTKIICSQGSYVETYAKENGYKYAYDTIIVDDILDSESENPVQNKHIAQHISELMNADANLALLINNLNNEVENAEVFVVEAIVDNENNTVSANANYFDVENAYSQGKNIILKVSETNSTGVVIGFLNGKTENDSVVWSAVLGSTNMQAELNKDGWTIEEWNFMERFETVKDVDIEANVLKVTFGDNVVKDVILPTGNGGNVIVDDALSSKSENPVQNKVVTNWLTGLNNHISNLDKEKSPVEHSHKIADIEDYVVDEVLDETSTNPVQNKVIHGVLQEIINNKAHISHKHKVADLEDYVVDSGLSNTSINPLQNKVVTNWITSLQGEIGKKASEMHTHKISDLDDYAVDEFLDSVSTNPVQNKVIYKALNDLNLNYKYKTVDMSSAQTITTLSPNTVNYMYGIFDTEEYIQMHFVFSTSEIANDFAEETVLILDFSSMESVPTITFGGQVKWLNGEPPEIVAGKVYMFSFVGAKRADDLSNDFYLGIGGEFA